MAFRFRRSMKLGPGLRMNVSKRGVGVSFGTTGLRSSVHSTGSRTKTIGIPGTGLSFVDRSNGGKKKLVGGGGSTRDQKIEANKLIVEKYQKYVHAITNMHQRQLDRIDWQKIIRTPAPFSLDERGPAQTEAAEKYHQYKPSILERMFKKMAEKKQEKLKRACEDAKQLDETNYKRWERLTDLASDVLDRKPEAYEQVFEKSNKFDDMRTRSTLFATSPHVVNMDVRVEPKDIIPKKKIQLTKTGRVSSRKMGKKAYYGTMRAFVCSHAIWAARSVMASLPIDQCIIHMTEKVIDTATGHYEQRIVLSVAIDRKTLEQLNLESINPADAMDNFTHNIDFRITKGFRPVKRVSI